MLAQHIGQTLDFQNKPNPNKRLSMTPWLHLFLLALICAAPLGAATPEGPPPLRRVLPPLLVEGEQISPYTIRAPFELAGHLILIQAEVAGQSGNFILDTGSEALILNAAHFAGGVEQPMLASTGTTGRVEGVRVTAVSDLAIDSSRMERLGAHVIDLRHIEEKKHIRLLGIIGYDVIKAYELLIDFQLRQLTLTQLDRLGNRLDSLAIYDEATDSLEARLQGHILAIEGEVDGHSVTFGLDSGAELNLIDKRAGRKVLQHFQPNRRTVLHGMAGSKGVEVIAGKLYHFSSGQQRCSGMRTILTNMAELNHSFGSRLDGLIGYEFLVTRRTILNYKREKLYFLPWYTTAPKP